MSTIVVVRKDKSACIGADTLSKFGGMKEAAEYVCNHEKIIKVGETYLAATGPAVSGLVLENYFRKHGRKANFTTVPAIFETMLAMHPVLKEQYYMNVTDGEEGCEYEVLQMNLLLANEHGIFGVYDFREACEYSRFYAFGTGARYALGAMHAVYDTLDDAKAIAQAGLSAAADFDDSTSGPFTRFTVKLKTNRGK